MQAREATACLGVNENGGVYHCGKLYDDMKKVEVVLKYMELLEEEGRVTCRRLGEVACVGKTYASQVIQEVRARTVVLGTMRPEKDIPRGIGSKTLTPDDELVLLSIYYDNPKALRITYQATLIQTTGTYVSLSTLSQWFKHRFPHKMTMRKTNKVPIDKFKPENVLRIHKFNLTMCLFLDQPHRIKFGDEKPLKGADLFNGKARKDLFTGLVPPTIVDSDFRNTYNVIGFCGIDVNVPAMDFYIVGEDEATTSATFMAAIQSSVTKGFLVAGDILVLDNAAIHLYRESQDLFDYLWSRGILLITANTCAQIKPH